MKRILSCLLVAVFVWMLIPLSEAETAIVEYLPDGSYFVTTIAAEDGPCLRGYTNQQRNSTYYNNSGVAQWKMTLYASFYYDGTTSYANSCLVSYTIYHDAWYYEEKQEETNGNVASGTLKMAYKVLGITIYTRSRSLTITCDKDGNIS